MHNVELQTLHYSTCELHVAWFWVTEASKCCEAGVSMMLLESVTTSITAASQGVKDVECIEKEISAHSKS